MKTIFATTALLDDGWARDVLVGIDQDGRIGSVVANAKARSDSIAVETLLPALCNLHSQHHSGKQSGPEPIRICRDLF